MMTRGSVAAMAAMKSEIEDALKSEAFQQLLQSAIQEALNVAVLKIIEPMTKTIAELQEKITSLESQLVRVENFGRLPLLRILNTTTSMLFGHVIA